MTTIFLAALFFVGVHLLVAGTTFRDRLVGILGERRTATVVEQPLYDAKNERLLG